MLNLGRRAAGALEGIAAFFLLGILLLSTGDVFLRALNAEWRILGVVEMVQLAFGASIFLALPWVFISGGNIVVNIMDGRMPKWTLRILVMLGSLASLCFIALMESQAIILSMDALAFRDETQDLRIPIFYYWMPIVAGFGLALVAQCILLARAAVGHEGQEVA